MKTQRVHNTLRITAIMLLIATSAGALAAGYSFMVEPSGNAVGISTDYLKPDAPFDHYFVPGVVLFTVIGVLSAMIAFLAIRQTGRYALLISMEGFIYIGWIAIQLTMVVAFHPLHAIVASIGASLVVIGGILTRKKMTGEVGARQPYQQ
jgi:hypothetical protein